LSHKKYRAEKNCLNCGETVEQKFCPNCGQENIEVRENFFHVAVEFVSDYFHYDSKLIKSTWPLFAKPGFLTKEYWDGKRVSYIHPLRLFFFVTILFVISNSFFYTHFADHIKASIIKPGIAADSSYLRQFKSDPKKLKDAIAYQKTEKRQLGKLRTGIDHFFKFLKYVTFFLLPVYALIFKILYTRRRPYYVDHLVYTMHLQSFVYFLFSITFLLPFAISNGLKIITPLSLMIAFIYILTSLHQLYRQSWWKTLLKSALATAAISLITAFTFVAYMLVDAIFIQ
jgi:hypothetical protein